MKFTTLLVAAAALAAGIITSQAQVYSQNVVGYANVPTASGGEYLITVPFKVGISNGANEVWPLVNGQPSLPDYSEVLIWNGTGFVGYFSDSTSSTLWDDVNYTQGVQPPLLPVGQGFFLIPNNSTTNTFVGTVAVNVGTSNSVPLGSGSEYLVAPAVPYGGSVTNGSPTTFAGGPCLSSVQGLPDYSEILVWNGNNLTYTGYFSDSTSSTLYDDANYTQGVTPPSISVGQGFFLIPNNPFTWKVGL